MVEEKGEWCWFWVCECEELRGDVDEYIYILRKAMAFDGLAFTVEELVRMH